MIRIIQELILREKNSNLQFSHITIYNIINIFCNVKNINICNKDFISIKKYKHNKNSKINTYEFCYYLFDIFILKNIIKQKIKLKPWKEGSLNLVDLYYIVKVINMTVKYVENNNWYQFLKSNKNKK